MGKTVKEWAGIDSNYKREDGTEMKHDELFGSIVDAIGVRAFEHIMPATKEEMAEAFAKDKYLNSIPLKKWDARASYARSLMARIGITHTSLSDGVCTLKAAARRWIQE